MIKYGKAKLVKRGEGTSRFLVVGETPVIKNSEKEFDKLTENRKSQLNSQILFFLSLF